MIKRLVRWSAAAIVLGVLAVPARAEDSDGWHFAAALDALTAGNAKKHNLNAANKICAAQVAGGAASCAGTATASGAFGARLGAYYHSGSLYAGPTVGFLAGGPTAGKITATTVPAGSMTRKAVDSTGRALLEFGARAPLGDVWAVGLGAGLGMALVSEKSTCSDSGALAGTCAASGFNSSVKRGWATWELGPFLEYRSLEFGFRFVSFGRKKYAPWSAYGAFLGGRF
ncbi:MAG: hypothetical protein ACHQ51_01545 [Elusimicrobiota bacterium]